MDKVSAYIPCYNVAGFLAQCIEGILAQTLPADEILIIDDGSRDRTVDVAARYPVRVIRHEKNLGLAAARNTAFREARNELVAALDADCVAQQQWLERLVSLAGSANVAVAGGKLVETVLDSVADRWRRVRMSQDWGHERLTNPPFMFGNNSVMRKSAVVAVGGYDERLRTNGEDVDLSLRLRARGCNFVYEPAAVVHHLRRDTIPSVLRMFWRHREGYEKPLAPRDVWRNWRCLHFGRARSALKMDWQAGRYELLGVDLLAFFHPVLLDLEKVERKGKPISATQPQAETK